MLGLNLTCGPTQSVLRIFARNFVQTCLGAPGSGLSRKNIYFYSKCLPGTRYLLLASLKVCDWPGHIFGATASPRSLTKKLAMSTSSTVHSGQHDTKYVTLALLMHAAFVADEIWGFMLEPARRGTVQTGRPGGLV